MQYINNNSFHEVSSIDILQDENRKREINAIIIQELQQMGYTKTIEILKNECQIKQSNLENQIEEFKQLFFKGEFMKGLQILQLSEQSYKKIQYELQKQQYIESALEGDINEAVLQMHSLQGNDEEKISLAKLIFYPNPRDCLEQLKIPQKIEEQRSILFYKINNFIQFGHFSLETQLDRVIKAAQQYQCNYCPYHYDNNKPQGILKDHKCQSLTIPKYPYLILQQFDNEIWIAKFSISGNYIACATKSNSIYICKIPSEIIKIPNAHLKDITCLLFSQNEQKQNLQNIFNFSLYSASNDCQIHIYNVNDGQFLGCLQQHNYPILSITRYNNQLFSGGIDNWIGIWNSKNELISQIKSRIVKNIMVNQKYLLLHQAAQPIIGIYENDGKYKTLVKEIEEQEQIVSSYLSNDLLILLTGKQYPKIHLWSLQKLQLVRAFFGLGENKMYSQCCFVGFQDQYIATGISDGNIMIFNKLNELDVVNLNVHKSGINYIDWNYQTKALLTASDDQSISILGLTELEFIKEIDITKIQKQTNGQNFTNLSNDMDSSDSEQE